MGDGGWVATHEDVTKQKRAEMELDRARRFLDTVIENIPLPIVVKEPDSQNILLVNQAFEKFIGLSRDVVIGHSAGALFSKEKADLIAKCDIEAVEAGQIVVSANLELDTAQSGLRNVTTTRLVVRDGGGKPQCLIVVIQDETEKKKAEQRLAFMAHHDALTGLANRAALLEKLEEASARQRRWGEPFSVLLLDIDRFKSVNDTLGHPAGDALLQEVSGQLRSSLRETDVLARLGGDEFAIIQAGENDPRQGATVLANRILEIVAKPFDINGNQLAIGASIGIAMAPEHGNSPDALLKMADLALYRVKSNGRNGFCFFEHEMSEASNARHLLEADLRSAISRNELELHYQPIVDTRTRKLCGVEALVRWRHPQRGLVFPDQFIALAEETSLITQIGEWVLQTACADAATWPPFVRVAVNLSPVQFRKSNLVETVTCALAKAGVPPERLELEITESALIDNATQCAATLHQLKTLGVTIALDDFGTGYSSLSQLTMFPFDRIKIDKSFTSNMTKRADCAAIVSAALTLAHSLDIATTAEGVETTEQLKLLRLAGVGAVQGYLFARPCPLPHVDFNRIYGDQALDDAA
jgi:diguanylate cyclase (GGDEF)-like protein/PAS domain S-box-containing protein